MKWCSDSGSILPPYYLVFLLASYAPYNKTVNLLPDAMFIGLLKQHAFREKKYDDFIAEVESKKTLIAEALLGELFHSCQPELQLKIPRTFPIFFIALLAQIGEIANVVPPRTGLNLLSIYFGAFFAEIGMGAMPLVSRNAYNKNNSERVAKTLKMKPHLITLAEEAISLKVVVSEEHYNRLIEVCKNI